MSSGAGPSASDVAWRYLQMWFDLTGDRRIAHNPDSLRFALQGCADGNIVLVRDDVPEATRRDLERVAADEAPLVTPDAVPMHSGEYAKILERDRPVELRSTGSLAYWFPEPFVYEHTVALVLSGTREAEDLLADDPLLDWWGQGHSVRGQIGAPWCMAMCDGEIAAIVETVNTGPRAIECGVFTAPHMRLRGFASAATAGWASIAGRDGTWCFYGTELENVASQRVTARLGLQFIGPGFGLR